MSQLDIFNFLPHLIWFFILFIFLYLIVFFFIVPSFFKSLKIRFLFFLYTIESSCKTSWFYTFLVKFFLKINFYSLFNSFSLFLRKVGFSLYINNFLHLKSYIRN